MAAIIAIIAFSIGLVLRLASISKGVFLTPETFLYIGLIALSVADVTGGWYPQRRA